MWNWFIELSARRASSGFGVSPISWQDIESWQRVTGVAPSAMHLDWILELDRLFLADMAKESRERVTTNTKAPRAGRTR